MSTHPFSEALKALKNGYIIKTTCNRRLWITIENNQPVDALRNYVFFDEDDYKANWQIIGGQNEKSASH